MPVPGRGLLSGDEPRGEAPEGPNGDVPVAEPRKVVGDEPGMAIDGVVMR